jgi:hypothetical protein
LFETDNLDGRTFALLGAMKLADPARTPVRGDLAHIALAGRYFVPHYAVPLLRRIGAGGAALRGAARADADTLAELPAGSAFEVLDIAGQTAWGQVVGDAGGDGGLVGYVALDMLEEAS